MPTYEYACTSCGQHTEVVQSFSDDPLTECPLCGGQLRKVFGSIGIVLKGSGFYKTDSRSTGKAAKAPKAGESGESSAKEASPTGSGTTAGDKSSAGEKSASSTSAPAGSAAAAAS